MSLAGLSALLVRAGVRQASVCPGVMEGINCMDRLGTQDNGGQVG